MAHVIWTVFFCWIQKSKPRDSSSYGSGDTAPRRFFEKKTLKKKLWKKNFEKINYSFFKLGPIGHAIFSKKLCKKNFEKKTLKKKLWKKNFEKINYSFFKLAFCIIGPIGHAICQKKDNEPLNGEIQLPC